MTHIGSVIQYKEITTMVEVISDPPEKGAVRQIGEGVGEAALSMVPIVEGPLAVLWVQFAGVAYEKRRQAWAEEISEAVNDLLGRVDHPDSEDLATNDRFLDALAYATATAVTTAHREKLDALRNAVLNAALRSDVDSDTQAIFLRHVRDLTITPDAVEAAQRSASMVQTLWYSLA